MQNNKTYLKKNKFGCPYLFLAPMEGVGDRPFRKAMATIGGFDEAVTEFIRVPCQGHVESLAEVYESQELSPVPLAAQIMGADAELVAAMGKQLEKRGAQRIDLNCGCPSNTVTGKGAGSSLLKDPDQLYKIGKALVDSCHVPVTIKMRSGYEDTVLFQENIIAAQETGISFLTLHPRTKKDGYIAPANWDLIALAKTILKIPVVGNGDINTVKDVLNMLYRTHCDAIMIGRGAVKDPFLFLKIKAHFENVPFEANLAMYHEFLVQYLHFMRSQSPARTKINKLKQILNFLFIDKANQSDTKKLMLRSQAKTPEEFLSYCIDLLHNYSF